MMKRISKVLAGVSLCGLLVGGSVCAAWETYNFSLGNTGKSIQHLSNSINSKIYISDPWTLDVQSIYCIGDYGIRFVPVMVDGQGRTTKICTESGIWCHGTGYNCVNYAPGDAALTYYKLGARQDDSYYATFTSSGRWNADRMNE